MVLQLLVISTLIQLRLNVFLINYGCIFFMFGRLICVLVVLLFGCTHVNNYHLVTFSPMVETVDFMFIYMCLCNLIVMYYYLRIRLPNLLEAAQCSFRTTTLL